MHFEGFHAEVTRYYVIYELTNLCCISEQVFYMKRKILMKLAIYKGMTEFSFAN